MWSPKKRRDGARNPFYDSMTQVRPGDVVFSFCDTLIHAIGIVQREAVTVPKPDFRTAGRPVWSAEAMADCFGSPASTGWLALILPDTTDKMGDSLAHARGQVHDAEVATSTRPVSGSRLALGDRSFLAVRSYPSTTRKPRRHLNSYLNSHISQHLGQMMRAQEVLHQGSVS